MGECSCFTLYNQGTLLLAEKQALIPGDQHSMIFPDKWSLLVYNWSFFNLPISMHILYEGTADQNWFGAVSFYWGILVCIELSRLCPFPSNGLGFSDCCCTIANTFGIGLLLLMAPAPFTKPPPLQESRLTSGGNSNMEDLI